MVRLAGAGEAGGDLLLAANLTADRRSLMAATPARAAPLRAGLFLIAVSLNGQQFAAPPRRGVVCLPEDFRVWYSARRRELPSGFGLRSLVTVRLCTPTDLAAKITILCTV